MKNGISAHCNITNPETAGYPYLESIKSYSELADEVIVVDGGTTDGSLEKIKKIPKVKIVKGEKWPREFDWRIIGRQKQRGLESCKYKWRMAFDVDYIFHEDGIDILREETEKAKTSVPAMWIRKWNVITKETIRDRGYIPYMINSEDHQAISYGEAKGKYYNQGTFLFPVVDGIPINRGLASVYTSKTNIYCYDLFFMTREQKMEQRFRFCNSYMRYLGRPEISAEESLERFMEQQENRKKHLISIVEHSKHIKEKL
jgi:glycosyltransferase involved in cell wall biosynthesis